ncbi:MAG TPA: hypothetical protein VM425_08480 [Myxococcota bacterium]|nr:hypothetical protein [Myxococcota bacterium]
MRYLLSGSLGLFILLGLLAASRAEDPSSFLDLRLDVKGSGLTIDSAILLGYARYAPEVSESSRVSIDSVSLRQDWDLIYWFVRNFGAGLSFSLGYILPVRSSDTSPSDQPDVKHAMRPHGGLGAALVLATAF